MRERSDTALAGAIYANELRNAATANRIGKVPYIPGIPVHTAWDIGHSDSTAIWFFQRVGFEYHLIDFFADSAQRLGYYLKMLQERGYVYGRHYLPHDDGEHHPWWSVAWLLLIRCVMYGRQGVVVVPRTDNVSGDLDVCR